MGTQKPATASDTDPLPSDLPTAQAEYLDNMATAAIRMSRVARDLEGAEVVRLADKLSKADQTARRALRLESEKPASVIQIGVLAQSRRQKSAVIEDVSEIRQAEVQYQIELAERRKQAQKALADA